MTDTTEGPSTDNLKDRELSLLMADVVDYSELDPYQLQAFFSRIIPEIADILDGFDTVAKNSWGDGIICVFRNPEKAARCALQIRDYFQNNNWTETPVPSLQIRIALHNGVVYEGYNPVQAEKDVVGTNVNLAARVEPVVPPNHIFTTEIFKNSIKSSVRDTQFEFDEPYDGEEMELAKGWGSEELFHLRWESDEGLSPQEIPSSSKEGVAPEEEALALNSFLNNGSMEEKKLAIDVLAQRGNIKAINVLTNTLEDTEGVRGDVRQRVAAQLSEIRDERVVQPLINSIKEDPQMSVANNAINSINELAEHGVVGVEVVDVFQSVLSDSDRYPDRLRIQAARALGQIRDYKAIQPLTDVLENQDNIAALRQAAAVALSNFSDERALHCLKESLDSSPAVIRARSLESLSKFTDKEAAQAISRILQDEEEEVGIRKIAAKRLSEFSNTREPISALIKALEDPDPNLRAEAINSLGELEIQKVEPKLEEMLLDSDEPTQVRISAATALGNLGMHESTDSLCDVIEEPNVELKQRAISSLGQINTEKSLDKLINLIKDDEELPEVRDVAILALQNLEKRKPVDSLIEICDSEDIELQRSALQVLGVLGTPKAVKKITSVYKNDSKYDVPVRVHASVALRRVSDNRLAQKTLIKGLKEESNGRVINATVESLLVMEASEATEVIAELVEDVSNPIDIRESGLFALALIADPSVEETIAEIATDQSESWRIRKIALRAIGALGTQSGDKLLQDIAMRENEPVRANIIARRYHELSSQEIRRDLKDKREELLDDATM